MRARHSVLRQRMPSTVPAYVCTALGTKTPQHASSLGRAMPCPDRQCPDAKGDKRRRVGRERGGRRQRDGSAEQCCARRARRGGCFDRPRSERVARECVCVCDAMSWDCRSRSVACSDM
eukprot:2067654-Rhodomonas_salina.3